MSTARPTPDTTPALSLVVCTRNRAAFLGPFFEAIEAIRTRHQWELILVDNGSSDDTPRLLREFAERAPMPVRVVRDELPGLGHARNCGWTVARAPIVSFTDDDCYTRHDYVDRMLEAFDDPTVGFVGGRVTLHDPEDLPVTIRTETEPLEFPAGRFIYPGQIHGANFAFRLEVLQRIGGFDWWLGAGTPYPSEDCDVLLRSALAGYLGRYVPAVEVAHHHRRRTEADLEKLKSSYLAGRGAFYMKALVDQPRRLRTLNAWRLSTHYHGKLPWFHEVMVGLRFLVDRRRPRRVQPSPARSA